MISTTRGEMPEDALEKKTGGHDNENETVSWVEYWIDGEMVHRSVHIDLKTGIPMNAEIGAF